jgi:hypothetical protein
MALEQRTKQRQQRFDPNNEGKKERMWRMESNVPLLRMLDSFL